MLKKEPQVAIKTADRGGEQITTHNGSPEAAYEAIALGIGGFETAVFSTSDERAEPLRKTQRETLPVVIVRRLQMTIVA